MKFSDFCYKKLIFKAFQTKKFENNCYKKYEMVFLKELISILLDHIKTFFQYKYKKYIKIFKKFYFVFQIYKSKQAIVLTIFINQI